MKSKKTDSRPEEHTVESLARDLDAIMLELRLRAYQGDKKAIHELWRTGINSAAILNGMCFAEKPKAEILKLAKTKLKWPFAIAAIHEHGKGNTTANPAAYAEWLGLGKGKGIILKKNGKGAPRKLRWTAESGFALHVRNQIEEDLQIYGHRTDAEILGSFYQTWKCRRDLKPDAQTRKNQKTLLQYVKRIAAIDNIHDKNQWMKAAELWVKVHSEGNPEALGLWPERVYVRAATRGTVFNAVTAMIQEGLEKIIAPPPK